MRPLLILSLWSASGLAWAGPDHVLVGLHSPADAQPLRERVAQLGGQVERCFQRARVCIVLLPSDIRPDLSVLQSWPGVRYAEADRLMLASPTGPPPPGDDAGTEDCPDQWELEVIGATEAWAVADGTWAPVIAVQDSGFLTSHEELQGRISGQYDYGDGDGVAEVAWSSGVPAHGTFIAGVIAGDPDNGGGRSGVAPYARVNLQKIADSNGSLYFSYAVSAMADIAEGDLGVRVLNYSIAGSTDSQSFHDAVSALADADILLVTAAGNCGSSNCSDADNDAFPMYPGNYDEDHIVVVASSNRDDGFNPYSHYGAYSVDLAAPGEDICSCGVYEDDDYYTSGGTSYATPLVAASAALLLEAHPDLTTTELARILRASAQEIPAWEGLVRSNGRLDLAAALKTSVPRLSEPNDASIDGTGELVLDVDNPGWQGQAWVVLSHGDALDMVEAFDRTTDQAWSLVRYQEGQAFELPDAGDVTVDQGQITVLQGVIDSHGSADLALKVRGRQAGEWVVTARVAMVSDGSDYLNSPYNRGSDDPTGFRAWEFQVRVTDVSTDTGWLDTGEVPITDPGGCGCGRTPARPGPTGWGWLLLSPLWLRRRRNSAAVGPATET
jgi:hypothetical protein